MRKLFCLACCIHCCERYYVFICVTVVVKLGNIKVGVGIFYCSYTTLSCFSAVAWTVLFRREVVFLNLTRTYLWKMLCLSLWKSQHLSRPIKFYIANDKPFIISSNCVQYLYCCLNEKQHRTAPETQLFCLPF